MNTYLVKVTAYDEVGCYHGTDFIVIETDAPENAGQAAVRAILSENEVITTITDTDQYISNTDFGYSVESVLKTSASDAEVLRRYL